MIYDNIRNCQNYFLDKDFISAFEFLKKSDELAVGRYELNNGMFANIQEFDTKADSECKTEAHKKFIDVQYVAYGNERMGFSLTQGEIVEDLTPSSDIYFVKTELTYIDLTDGDFAIFFTNDYHRPSIGNGGRVRKVVVKIPKR